MDFIKFEKTRGMWRGLPSKKPAIIIPRANGKKYDIQYAGCGCFHTTIRGDFHKLPSRKFARRGVRGTIFDPNFWYLYNISNYWYSEISQSNTNKRNFIYDLIETELEDRLTTFDNKNIFKKIWPYDFKNVKIVRNDPNNNEALIAIKMIYKNKDTLACLTWENCD